MPSVAEAAIVLYAKLQAPSVPIVAKGKPPILKAVDALEAETARLILKSTRLPIFVYEVATLE